MKWLTSDNKMLGYELMKAYPNISCFSTTRHGGCSKGNYTSFNCNGYCGDEAEDVNRNRELLRSLLPGESVELVIPHQTHSDHVKVVDTIHVNTELEGVDALVTDIPGYCLCVSTADCVPVLLYDTRKKVVAAIHAGWRGTVARIVEKTVSVMSDQYGSQGKDLIACIGPSISLEAFEVGDEVYQAFYEAGFDRLVITVMDKSNLLTALISGDLDYYAFGGSVSADDAQVAEQNGLTVLRGKIGRASCRERV